MASEYFGKLSRRDFLAYCAATAAALGLSDMAAPSVVAALEKLAQGRAPLIWLSAQGCKGCAVSLLNSDEPTPGQIILDSFSMRFFPLAMAGSGQYAVSAITETMDKFGGEYILVVEGSVPGAAGGKFDTMGFEELEPIPIETWVRRVARGARATLAIGTCASYGGIPAAGPTVARDIAQVLGEPVPAVPGCPPHPDWIVGTLVKLILFGKRALVAELDGDRRPTEFYGQVVHDNCPRRAAFDAGIFVDSFNDNLRTPNACLLTKGCKGPLTHSDCPTRRWNQRINWCIGAGAPCNGCTEPSFYTGFAPLFEMLPSVKPPASRPAGVSAETVGAAIGAGTAVGMGVHLVAQVARGKIGGSRRARPGEELARGEGPAKSADVAEGTDLAGEAMSDPPVEETGADPGDARPRADGFLTNAQVEREGAGSGHDIGSAGVKPGYYGPVPAPPALSSQPPSGQEPEMPEDLSPGNDASPDLEDDA